MFYWLIWADARILLLCAVHKDAQNSIERILVSESCVSLATSDLSCLPMFRVTEAANNGTSSDSKRRNSSHSIHQSFLPRPKKGQLLTVFLTSDSLGPYEPRGLNTLCITPSLIGVRIGASETEDRILNF